MIKFSRDCPLPVRATVMFIESRKKNPTRAEAETLYPDEEVEAAEEAYIGGYSYEVSAGQKASLEAAGYTVETV